MTNSEINPWSKQPIIYHSEGIPESSQGVCEFGEEEKELVRWALQVLEAKGEVGKKVADKLKEKPEPVFILRPQVEEEGEEAWLGSIILIGYKDLEIKETSKARGGAIIKMKSTNVSGATDVSDTIKVNIQDTSPEIEIFSSHKYLLGEYLTDTTETNRQVIYPSDSISLTQCTPIIAGWQNERKLPVGEYSVNASYILFSYQLGEKLKEEQVLDSYPQNFIAVEKLVPLADI